jgi:hypothetical protein
MTDRARPVRPPRAAWTLAGGLTVFLVVLTLLFWQVRIGRDPALGAAGRPDQVVTVPPARRVLVRRIVRRVIVERVIISDDGAVTRRPAVVSVVSSPSVPAPAAVPAPTPAPAPLVTRTS